MSSRCSGERQQNARAEGRPIELFYSYSHEDEEYRKKLGKHLSVLRRAGLITDWHDRNIDAGAAWQEEIDRHLLSADIVLLLVSALEKAYQFVLWLVPTLEKFPRAQKFLLGDRIQSTALDVVEGLVEATYTRNRAPVLRAVNLRLEKLRLLFRLATDLQILDLRRYEHAARSIDEIGRLVGGWLKASHAPEAA